MSDAQTWAVIGVLAATLLSAMGLISGTFTRVVRAEMRGLRGELVGKIGELRGELGGQIAELRGDMVGQMGELRGELGGQIGELRGEIGAIKVKVESIDRRLDGLDRDVTALTRRVMGEDPT